jgi:hypothetical protein
MAEAYGPEHQVIAEQILGDAFAALLTEGFDAVEACHALVHLGLDTLPGCCCHEHLAAELSAVIDACEDRLDELREAAH